MALIPLFSASTGSARLASAKKSTGNEAYYCPPNHKANKTTLGQFQNKPARFRIILALNLSVL
jgi:hypothetical protein